MGIITYRLPRTCPPGPCTLRDVLYSQIDTSYYDCWLWTGRLYVTSGYGLLVFQEAILKAHRVSYRLHNGPIRGKRMVCHACDMRRCVAPHHLWLGTPGENVRDRHRKLTGEIIWREG